MFAFHSIFLDISKKVKRARPATVAGLALFIDD
jgi:hypothetical protein